MGIIESIEMAQFMCHKYLTFSLGPQINFIIGMCSFVISMGNIIKRVYTGHNGSA